MRAEQKRPVTWEPPKSSGIVGLDQDPLYAYKWVNTDVQGDTACVDSMLANRLEQGWTPVDPKDNQILMQPKYAKFIKDGQFRRKGQVLMKMEKDLAEARRQYYINQDRMRRGISMRDAVRQDSGVTDFDLQGSVRTQTYIGNSAREL